MKQLISMTFLGLLLMGCSTVKTPLNQATVPHWDRMPAQTAEPGQTAKVVVVRDEGHSFQYDYLWEVAVNQRVRGEVDTREQAVFYVEPGRLEVGVKMPMYDWRSVTTMIEAGETQYFRVGWYDDPYAWIPIIGWVTNASEPYIRPYGAEGLRAEVKGE